MRIRTLAAVSIVLNVAIAIIGSLYMVSVENRLTELETQQSAYIVQLK